MISSLNELKEKYPKINPRWVMWLMSLGEKIVTASELPPHLKPYVYMFWNTDMWNKFDAFEGRTEEGLHRDNNMHNRFDIWLFNKVTLNMKDCAIESEGLYD